MRGNVPQTRSPTRSRPSGETVDGMKNLLQVPFSLTIMEGKWLLSLLGSIMISILLLLIATLSFGFLGYQALVTFQPARDSVQPQNALQMKDNTTGKVPMAAPIAALPPPPKLAYLISGTKGDGFRMQRTLQALYHPHNYYLLHLDLEAPIRERVELARYVRKEPMYEEVKNVFVVGKANLVTYKGPTMVAATLHGAAILLRMAKDWDWFINLSASDYPLVTQDGEWFSTKRLFTLVMVPFSSFAVFKNEELGISDQLNLSMVVADLLHVFSYLPKDLNFIEHTSDIGWKE